MQATIVHQFELPSLPSASGVEVIGDTAYIIGDDSPFLYCLNAQTMAATGRIPLFESTDFGTGRIPKKLKPDLECLTALTTATGETGLLTCGSGAGPVRETGFWITLPTSAGAAEATVHPLSFSGLYAALRPALPAGVVLNLEASAATTTALYLFQRTVGAVGSNFLYELPLQPTLDFLWQRTPQAPAFQLHAYDLPAIEGCPAGFSGATVFEEKIFVTASVENTHDAVADGAILGSFVGMLEPLGAARGPLPLALAQLVLPDGQPYRGKVESISVRRALAPDCYDALLVTDDDAGGSTAVVVELRA